MTSEDKKIADCVRKNITSYPDWPKKGINFLNTVELCREPEAFNQSIDWFTLTAELAGEWKEKVANGENLYREVLENLGIRQMSVNLNHNSG